MSLPVLIEARDVFRGLTSDKPFAGSCLINGVSDSFLLSTTQLWLQEFCPGDQPVFLIRSREPEIMVTTVQELGTLNEKATPGTLIYVPCARCSEPISLQRADASKVAGNEATGETEVVFGQEGAWLRFLSVVAKLRGQDGCPWDREQTYTSLAPYVIEEAHEVVAAVHEKDVDKLKEELGDLLLEIGLYCQVAREMGDFGPVDVLSGIVDKLMRRHPHVFGCETITDAVGVRERWDEIKRAEPGRYNPGHSLMDEVQKGLPALLKAQKQQSLAAEAGFDWSTEGPVFDKVKEEIGEVFDARTRGCSSQTTDEVGDLLFACVNLSRHLGVDAETALLGSVEKFARRFRYIEKALADKKLTTKDVDLEYLDQLWAQAKCEETRED